MNRKARKAERRHGMTGEQWMALVRGLPCAVTVITEGLNRDHMSRCVGPMQAHHAGPKPGMGLKCSDFETAPMCLGHHRELDMLAGPFKGLVKSELRRWEDNVIEETRMVLLGRLREGVTL